MAGARLTEVSYSGGPNLKKSFDPLLPEEWYPKVHQIPQQNTTVDCPIYDMGEFDNVPGTWWDGTYVWPDPPTPPAPEAPQNEQSLFIGAVDNIEKKITQNIIDHAFSHDPETDDVAQRWITLCQIVSGAGYNDPE